MDHERYRHMHGQSMSSMKKASFEITLKEKRQLAVGTMAFVFAKPAGFTFKAGQHVRMTLMNPAQTDVESDSRFLSLASSPQDADLVFAMRMRDTAFKRILRQMQIGEKVLIQILLNVPHGAFALHEDTSKPAAFLVGGIGIVPAYSMIKDATERKLPHKLFLFYSNRRPEDAPFLEELEQLAKQNTNFTLIATMTEPEKSAKLWQGETGFINHSMLTKHLGNLRFPMYYLAGLPAMTSAMKTLLAGAGVKEDRVQAEEFTGFNLNEIEKAPVRSRKRHVLIAAIALVVILVGITHVVAATSISKIVSLNNPIVYVMAGIMLLVLPFKLKHIRRLIRGYKKSGT